MKRPRRKPEDTSLRQNRNYPAGSFDAALNPDRSPELRLEFPPSLEPLPTEELSDMVPEFMHRDFYRSEEGLPIAFPAAATPSLPKIPEAPRQLPFPKAGAPRKQVRFVERSPHPEPPPEVPKSHPTGQAMQAKEPGPLLPLRSSEAERRGVAEAPEASGTGVGRQAALRTDSRNEERFPQEPQSSRASSPQGNEGDSPGVPKRSWSPALVAVLLLLLGLVLWREQAYRELLAGEQLPLPVTIPEPLAAEEPLSPLDGLPLSSLGPFDPDRNTLAEEGEVQLDQDQAESTADLESLMGETSPATDPGDLFPVAGTIPSTQTSPPTAPGENSRDVAASGSAQDRQMRLQSSGLFPQTGGGESSSAPGTAGAPTGGTQAGSEAASLFPAVESTESSPATVEIAPQHESPDSRGFPVVSEAERASTATQPKERPRTQEPLTLPPPVLPESLPTSTSVAPIGEPSQYHISEPTF